MKTSCGVPICWMKPSRHDDDAVAERHSLDLVVGDVDEGGVDLLAQLDDLRAHLVAELGVEVGQRLVHQEDLRVPDDGAADGDTLPLAAGQRLRLTVEVLGDVEDFARPHARLRSISAFGVFFSFREKAMLS